MARAHVGHNLLHDPLDNTLSISVVTLGSVLVAPFFLRIVSIEAAAESRKIAQILQEAKWTSPASNPSSISRPTVPNSIYVLVYLHQDGLANIS